jgi:hypothetical protein
MTGKKVKVHFNTKKDTPRKKGRVTLLHDSIAQGDYKARQQIKKKIKNKAKRKKVTINEV